MRSAAKSLFIGHSLPDPRLGFQRIHGRELVYTTSTFAKAEHNAASLIGRRLARTSLRRVGAAWTPFRRYFTTGERAGGAGADRAAWCFVLSPDVRGPGARDRHRKFDV